MAYPMDESSYPSGVTRVQKSLPVDTLLEGLHHSCAALGGLVACLTGLAGPYIHPFL